MGHHQVVVVRDLSEAHSKSNKIDRAVRLVEAGKVLGCILI